MGTTLIALAIFCAASLAYALVIPMFGRTKLVTGFLPKDIREAAKDHPDPAPGRRAVGYVLTAIVAALFVGVMVWLGADGVRRGYGFWQFFWRFMLMLYGYKLFDIVVQDQLVVVTLGYFIRFYPETRDCPSWHDRNFNTKNQLVRLVLFPFCCALTAWICTLFT